MYSSEDLERFYFQYKTELLPRGVSIQDLCIWNKVPYNILSQWYTDTGAEIVVVTVAGRPSEEGASPAVPSLPRPQPPSITPVRILVEIRMSNGLHSSQKNKNYQELVKLVEKLEGLC